MSALGRFDPEAVPVFPGERIPPAVATARYASRAAVINDDDPPIADEVSGETSRFTAEHGTCVAVWASPHYVRIEIARFADSRGELSAEIIVSSTVPGLERQLAQRRVPLLGPRAITDLAGYLAKRRHDPVVDWPELLEASFVSAVKAHRDGEPAIA